MYPVNYLPLTILLMGNLWLLTESRCPAQPPCSCINGVINCSGKSLERIPYMVYEREVNYHTLAYNHNRLSIIEPSVFANLNITRLLLDHNNISEIAQAAFNGIEGTLRELNLSHNALKRLPVPLGYLRFLNTLDVAFNPLDGERHGLHPRETFDDFTDDVMREIGDTVTSLTFGDSYALFHWPRSIGHEIHLERLRLTGSTINYMRSGWFRGFENTLTSLTILDYQLVQVPVDLALLTRLSELTISNNRNEAGDSFLVKAPFLGIADTLTSLTLNYDNLTVFPEVVRHLTRLQNLSLDGNALVWVSEQSVRYMQNTSLEFLSLKRCSLKRPPEAISDLKQLVELDLSNNAIKTIEAPDIIRMPALKTLRLSGNPLKYLSRSALRSLSSLILLDLSNSGLTLLPRCILNLRNVKVIDLTGSPIDCTCQIYWVKRWLVYFRKHVTFLGDCETIRESVDKYIHYRIPTCPQYLLP